MSKCARGVRAEAAVVVVAAAHALTDGAIGRAAAAATWIYAV